MKPPFLARLLVRVLSGPADRDLLLQDLAERFVDMVRDKGPREAKRWYWRQAISVVPWSLRPAGGLLWSGHWAGLPGELKSGLRTLSRKPLHALGVSGTLALGIAAALVTFAVAWTVWLAPLPIPDPDRVVRLYEVEPPLSSSAAGADAEEAERSRRHLVSEALAADLHAHDWETIEAFSRIARGAAQTEWSLEGGTYQTSSFTLNPEGFGILGIAPILGRLPVLVEEEVVLSEGFWRSAFGADPDIVGRRLTGAYGPVEIVGVVPVPAGFPGEAELGFMMDWRVQMPRSERILQLIARVRSDATVEEAEAEMNAYLAGLAEAHPEHVGWAMEATPLADDLVAPYRSVLALLLAAGAIFLLLAAINVTGLVAGRRVDGRHDRSIRLALGASEIRLFRASLVETGVLVLIGTGAGILASLWLIGPLGSVIPQEVPRLQELAVTLPMVLAGVAAGLAVAVVLGVVGHLASWGARGARPSVGRAPAWRAVNPGGRRALVVGQVALTTLLTAGGAAVLHRVSTLRAVDLGFEAEGVSATTGFLDDASAEANWALLQEVVDRLGAQGLPTAFAFNTPMDPGSAAAFGGQTPVFSVAADADSPEVFYQLHPVTPRYFEVMGIPLLAGRPFRRSDDASSGNVVVVSEDFARGYLPPGAAPEELVGQTLDPVMLMYGESTVVGIVGSTRHEGPDTPSMPDLYIPFAQQQTVYFGSLLVRGEQQRAAEAVTAALAELTPDVEWSPMIPYTTHVSEWFAPFRLMVAMVGAVAILGLLLASLGLYSIMAYRVVTRRQEIGVRKAVGAAEGRLFAGVIARGLVLAGVGALLGLGLWYYLRPLARGLIDGMDAGGPLIPLAVAIAVGGTCLIATAVPAIRAARVDPVVSLRSE